MENQIKKNKAAISVLALISFIIIFSFSCSKSLDLDGLGDGGSGGKDTNGSTDGGSGGGETPVITDGADYLIKSVNFGDLPGSVSTGDSITIQVEVKNQGSVAASTYGIEVLISQPTMISLATISEQASLASLATKQHSFVITFGNNIPVGNHTLKVRFISSNDAHPDNDYKQDTKTIAVNGKANLIPSGVGVANGVLTFSLLNNGTLSATGSLIYSRVSVYSGDPQVSALTALNSNVHSISLGSLSPNTSSSQYVIDFPNQYSLSIQAGYYIKIEADTNAGGLGQVTEIDEVDNVLYYSVP